VSWPMCVLGDVAPAKPIKLNSFKQSDNFWQVTLDHIESGTGRLLERNIKPLSEAGTSTHAFDERHVLYSKLRPYLNKVLLPDGIGIGTTELVPMLPDPERLDRDYLAYYLKSNIFVNWVSSQTAGAKMPRVSMNTFWEHEIPLPPLPEQKRIAAILDKADSLRRKNQQAIQLADKFLRAVFLDMFGDPVTNPKGWEIGKITSLAEVITGYAFKSSEFVEESDDAIRLCRGANTLTGYFHWSDTVYWPKQKTYGLDQYLIKQGDIILAMDRPWISSGLKVCIADNFDKPTYLVQRVARLRPTKPIYSDFIYSCIKSKSFESHCCPTETTVPHISPVELKNFEVMLPSETELKRFHEVVQRVRSLNRNLDISNCKADMSFNALSQKAFAGEL